MVNSPGEQTRNESYQAGNFGRQLGEVLEFIRSCGPHGATIEEISVATKIKDTSVCGRKGKLEEDGLVVQTELRRIGRSGRAHHVFVAAEFANGGREGDEQRREALAGETDGGTGSNDPGREVPGEAQGHSDKVPSVASDRGVYSKWPELAAFKTQRAETPTQLNLEF